MPTEVVDQRRWDEFFRWGRKLFPDQSVLDEQEREYKLKAAEKLSRARASLMSGDSGWFDLAKQGMNVNFLDWRLQAEFKNWYRDAPADVVFATKMLWDDRINVVNRINGFLSLAPTAIHSKLAEPATVLHMAMGAEQFPPFRKTQISKAFELTGFPAFEEARVERRGDMYYHALKFFDNILEQSRTRDVLLRDRLDAQGFMWGITYYGPSDEWPESDRDALLRYLEP